MKIQFLGHSCFKIELENTVLLTDPYLSGNPLAPVSAKDVRADYILVSHGHGDHVGDAAQIAKKSGGCVITTPEVARELFEPKGVKSVHGNIGGTVELPFGSVEYFQALHSCGVPGGIACGFVVRAGGKTLYFAGDTGLMSDMALLREYEIDVAMLPIGGTYTMDVRQAARAVEMIAPGAVVPMHYNTFPAVKADPQAFAAAIAEQGIARPVVLNPGESMEL